MSDKVTPLYPAKERKRKIVRGIVSLLAAVLLVGAALGVILFRKELNLDKLRRYVTYLNVRDSSTYGEYSFDAHSGNAYSAFGSGLALASVGGLDVYDDSGKAIFSVPVTMGVPAISAGDRVVLAYDVGGTAVSAVSLKKGVVLQKDIGKMLLDADISNGDTICYASAADGYKTVLTVLNDRQEETYHWYSASQYLPVCAVSDDGGTLGAIGVGQNGGEFESEAILFRTTQKEPVGSCGLGPQLILDLDFVASEKLCAVGETNLTFLDTAGEKLGEYAYGSAYLRDFDLNGNGFIALSLNMNKAGSHYAVATVGPDGKELARRDIDAEVLSISAAGNYVAVLTARQLTIYTSDLTPYAQTTEVESASDVLMRKDGTAILVGNGTAHLYLP